MGVSIHQESFSPADFRRFSKRLRQSLEVLESLLQKPGFGEGPTTLGAELEMSIVDHRGRALRAGESVLDDDPPPRLQAELNQFNLEYNLTPVAAEGEPFGLLEREMAGILDELDRRLAGRGGRIATVGILPTLRPEDLEPGVISDIPRFHVLSRSLRKLRGGRPFDLRIDGPEPLVFHCDDVSLEGANNSFQVHMRVPPDTFAPTFNALQLLTPLAVALGANSPTFLGHRLWQETRIPLFRQAVDSRATPLARRLKPSRVLFGTGWVRRGALELFAEAVSLFPPLLPAWTSEDPREAARGGETPPLPELALHLSSVWPWNRPVYDHRAGGHLRIELRALPAGPTPADMLANAAFLIGSAVALHRRIDRILPAFPFWCAEYNFFRAAKHGLAADLLWPPGFDRPPRERSVMRLIAEQLTHAEEGLAELGVAGSERQRLLGLVRKRLEKQTNGARWQERRLAALAADRPRDEALEAMFAEYQDLSRSGRPVHEWEGPR